MGRLACCSILACSALTAVMSFIISRTSIWLYWIPETKLRAAWLGMKKLDMPGEAYLQDFDWRIRNLSEADRAAFHRDGFLFIRNAFPPKPLEDILGYAQEQHFTDDGVSAVSSWAGDVWLRSNLARDFWHHSPAARYASRIMHDEPIRMRGDFITGLEYGDAGHCWHGDANPASDLTMSQAGLSVWIPLTPVVQNVSGGSLVTANRSLLPARCLLDAKPHQVPEDCYPLVDQAGVSYDYDIGDALLFGETTWHRTQPVYKSSAGRWTWVGRMVPHYDALACGPRPCDLDKLENSSDLSFWCAPMLFPQQFPDEYLDVLRHKKSLSHEHELMEAFLKMILGKWYTSPSRLKSWESFFKWVFARGWLSRKLWPQWKRCLFGGSPNAHFKGLSQNSRHGRYGVEGTHDELEY
mmetsp:Transcript_103020/g.276777  ORF Transcript_103020/g.276777 Transcript_103020/m.276777 type:complete len:410 (-) Transcript_103020:267-1496(-)